MSNEYDPFNAFGHINGMGEQQAREEAAKIAASNPSHLLPTERDIPDYTIRNTVAYTMRKTRGDQDV